jgi:CBS domain-containing protein
MRPCFIQYLPLKFKAKAQSAYRLFHCTAAPPQFSDRFSKQNGENVMKVQRILATKGMQVITITPEKQIREAVTLMSRHNIGALVVVDDTKAPIGILSERDVIRHLATDENIAQLLVTELMTHDLITGTPQDDTHSLAHTMTERRFRHIPIVQDGALVGIVSIGDIVKAQRDQYRGEIDTLETQIMAKND